MTFKIQIFFVTTLIFYKKPQMSKNQIFEHSESSNLPTYLYSCIFFHFSDYSKISHGKMTK